jgi:hypothetical protein
VGERTRFFTIFSYGRKIQKPFGFNLVEIWLTTHLFVCFCSLWYYDVALAWRWNIDPSKEDVKIFVLAKYPTPATMVMGKEESSHSHFLMLMEYPDWRDQELSSDREDEYESLSDSILLKFDWQTHLFECFCSLCLFLLLMLMIFRCCLSIKMNRNTQPQHQSQSFNLLR